MVPVASRLEGNTYSLLDTERLLIEGNSVDTKSVAEAQMILNHKDAIEFIVGNASEIGVNRYTITNLHAMLAHNLLSNPFEQAFFLMVHLPYLQPFEDVNKRVSRLAANIPLAQLNLVPLSFVDVPKELYTRGLLAIYELNQIALFRDVFMWAYERSSHKYGQIQQTLGQPDLFRMKYREQILQAIREIVAGAMNRKAASEWMQQSAKAIPDADRLPFVEAAETELLSLHDGNFARYKISPAQFQAWRLAWDQWNLA